MPRRKPVGVIIQNFHFGDGGKYRIEFVFCVDSREPQVHKLRSFAKNRITCEIHPFACVNIGDFYRDCFQTHYMIEEARRVTIFGWRYINVSVEWLGTLVHFYDTTGVPWTDNILVPELRWGDGGNYKTWDVKTQYVVRFVGRSVPWCGAVPFCAAYLPTKFGKYARNCSAITDC